MKFILSAVMVLAFQASAATFDIDPSHSSIEFKIRHLLGKVTGKFKDFNGEFNFDEKKPVTSTGTMKINVASIDTSNEKRDGHLKSPDFFDAEKFKDITFTAKKFTPAGKGKYKLTGDMTIRDVTKPVTFNVEYMGLLPKDPMGKTRAAFMATTKINRKDFGIVWNKPMDTESLADKAKKAVSKNMLGDDVDVEVNIEAIAK